jgi:hypothetical protein
MMEQAIGLVVLERVHSALSPGERDELLQSLLVAAASGGDAMIRVLQDLCLVHAVHELVGAYSPGRKRDTPS